MLTFTKKVPSWDFFILKRNEKIALNYLRYKKARRYGLNKRYSIT